MMMVSAKNRAVFVRRIVLLVFFLFVCFFSVFGFDVVLWFTLCDVVDYSPSS